MPGFRQNWEIPLATIIIRSLFSGMKTFFKLFGCLNPTKFLPCSQPKKKGITSERHIFSILSAFAFFFRSVNGVFHAHSHNNVKISVWVKNNYFRALKWKWRIIWNEIKRCFLAAGVCCVLCKPVN
jgi:hypothetical protein